MKERERKKERWFQRNEAQRPKERGERKSKNERGEQEGERRQVLLAYILCFFYVLLFLSCSYLSFYLFLGVHSREAPKQDGNSRCRPVSPLFSAFYFCLLLLYSTPLSSLLCLWFRLSDSL